MNTICLVMQRLEEEQVVVSLPEVLTQAGFEGEFRIFYKVELAREYWVARGKEVEFFLVEDFILTQGDGVDFVRELGQAGQPALLLSDFEVEGLPSLGKTFVSIGGGGLLAMIHQIHQSAFAQQQTSSG